ncbi:hypothetical protein WAI453_009937 [Rhynchosporium graminicola]
MLSSPDPLNDSPTYHSPSKPRHSSRPRRSLPLQGSSPKKQTFELDVGNSLSPQKIRVTVEAGESDVENVYSFSDGTSVSPTRAPKNRRRERTTTTRILVKGLSDSENEGPLVAITKRGRGRPRKSIVTPVPAKKPGRSSTPIHKSKRKSIGSLVDGDDDEDVNFQIGKGVELGRGKGRSKSRSRSTKGKRTSVSAAKDVPPESEYGLTSRKGKGRAKVLEPEQVDVLENGSCEGNVQDHRQDLEGFEDTGVLEPIHSNSQARASPYSTIRSTTTAGGTQSDVVIARFNLGDETPQRTGWSSPQTFEAPQPSSSRQRADGYLSPSVSPAKSAFTDESVTINYIPNSSRRGSVFSDNDEQADERRNEEYEEEIDQYQDFDTILESEGFSMISVDSVPSLREHFSSPANQPEKQLSSKFKDKSLLPTKETAAYDDSFSAAPVVVLEAATPRRKPQNPRLLSVQKTRADHSFSSIPPDVLQAATPAQISQVSKLISQNNPGNDSFSSVAPEVLEAATPQRILPKKRLSAAKLGVNDQYEDSFSAIPADVLDAATPAAARQTCPTSERLSIPVHRLSLSPSQTQTTDLSATRLLTPDETPSPPTDGSNDQVPASNENPPSQPAGHVQKQVSGQESSMIQSHMPSSPPSIAPRRYTYTAHLRQNRGLNKSIAQTPSIVFSSPSLPPPIQIGRAMPSLALPSEQVQRPLLSPTVRAGRMLQDIVVPSSSTRSRSQSLGSPFKSPAADRRSSTILAQESLPSPVHERLAAPLPRLDLSGHFGESSSQRYSGSSQQVDPFRNSTTTQQRSPSPEEKQQYTLELPQQRRCSDPRRLISRSEPQTSHSDDAMSWQAEEEIPILGSGSSPGNHCDIFGKIRSSTTAEQRWAAERASVAQDAANANISQVIVIDSEDKQSMVDQDEDEDFGLLLETLNSSSPVVERQETPKETVERPRRSKLPSPWRKNSKRLVYSDELSQMPSSPPEATIPAAKLIEKQMTMEPTTVRRIVPEELNDETDTDMSQYQVPQKANFNPRPRKTGNLDLSALLGTSPPHPLSGPLGPQNSIFHRQSRPSQAFASEIPEDKPTLKMNELKVDKSADLNPMPQKMPFNPRPKAASTLKPTSDVPALFGSSAKPDEIIKYPAVLSSSPVSMPLTTLSPSRINSNQALRTPSSEVSPSDCVADSRSSNVDKENQVLASSRTLKWTETLRLDTTATANVVLPIPLPSAASPTKSCLRSPLKTPSAGSGYVLGTSNLSPSKGVTWVSSSPTPESPMCAELSATTWSKDHWRLLDTIAQTWKPEYNNLPMTGDEKESSARRRRNSTRVISRLLGKTVFSGHEKMKLEQWHLEAVDEFRGCVPGWQEKVVAMRLFALMVGEEKRAKGLAGGGKAGNYDHLN